MAVPRPAASVAEPAAPRAPEPAALPVPVRQPQPVAGALPQPVERRRPRRQRQMWFFLRNPWRGLIFKFAVGIAVASLFTVYQEHWRDRLPGAPTQKTANAGNHGSSQQVTLVTPQ